MEETYMDHKERKARPIPAVGVGGLVFNREGQVLLVARRNPPRAGEWHIPGGRLEPGETLAHCCQREIFEETGIHAIPGNIVAIADRQIDGFHYVIVDFLAILAETEETTRPQPGSDALDAGWFDPEHIDGLPLVEGLKEVITAGKRLIRGENRGLLLDSHHSWLYA
jgi:ADP-ribose pyrophosphatase YjhB (NUDIX family)